MPPKAKKVTFENHFQYAILTPMVTFPFFYFTFSIAVKCSKTSNLFDHLTFYFFYVKIVFFVGGKVKRWNLKKGKTDEWYTPKSAVKPILKYIKPNSVIWCPFDTKDSNFVKLLNDNNHTVIFTHIEIDCGDFFKIEPPECDYIISNPPYSIRNKILTRLFNLKIPFMMLMNVNGIFDSKIRWDLFKDSNFTLLYLKGRVNYMKEYNITTKTSSPPFQSVYICNDIFNNKQIVFDD